MHITEIEARELAPNGILRAAINTGNAVLARREPAPVGASGVSVDLAQHLAQQAGLALELVIYATARDSVQGVKNGAADFGFFAIDPKRGQDIAFTAPYVLIEGSYLVAEASPIQDAAEVDQPTHTVVVGQGSAYDLFLTRELKQATIARAATSPDVVDTFLQSGADVAAGVRQQLEADAQRLGDLRLLPGHFMLIRQAMGVSHSRGPRVAALLSRFLEDAKATGFVAEAIVRHRIPGVAVAPAENTLA